jgi:hypothetical protein
MKKFLIILCCLTCAAKAQSQDYEYKINVRNGGKWDLVNTKSSIGSQIHDSISGLTTGTDETIRSASVVLSPENLMNHDTVQIVAAQGTNAVILPHRIVFVLNWQSGNTAYGSNEFFMGLVYSNRVVLNAEDGYDFLGSAYKAIFFAYIYGDISEGFFITPGVPLRIVNQTYMVTKGSSTLTVTLYYSILTL